MEGGAPLCVATTLEALPELPAMPALPELPMQNAGTAPCVVLPPSMCSPHTGAANAPVCAAIPVASGPVTSHAPAPSVSTAAELHGGTPTYESVKASCSPLLTELASATASCVLSPSEEARNAASSDRPSTLGCTDSPSPQMRDETVDQPTVSLPAPAEQPSTSAAGGGLAIIASHGMNRVDLMPEAVHQSITPVVKIENELQVCRSSYS